jgi:hypothetical protein
MHAVKLYEKHWPVRRNCLAATFQELYLVAFNVELDDIDSQSNADRFSSSYFPQKSPTMTRDATVKPQTVPRGHVAVHDGLCTGFQIAARSAYSRGAHDLTHRRAMSARRALSGAAALMRFGFSPSVPQNHRADRRGASPSRTSCRSEPLPAEGRLFCVTTVRSVCTIKAPVPIRAEDT